jgi:hypothetical protein
MVLPKQDKMYKIVTDATIVTLINAAAKLRENNEEVNYCEFQKHPIREEWAIPVNESILRKYNLQNIEELLSNNIETLPDDWEWAFPHEKFRIIIPNFLILRETSLRALISYCDANNIDSVVSETHSYIYISEIFEEHRAIFGQYEEITIEHKDVLEV